jgi:thiamine biosynthesis lipoprotein
MLRRGFRAMGTDVELLLDAPPATRARRALDAAERELRRLERLLSRFLPDSELSELNRRRALTAGPDLLRVTELALAARERTGGRFDPTVHDAVERAGYDRSFEHVPPDGPGTTPPSGRCGGEVRLDRRHRRISLGPGVRLDLGGIAKGDAVDRACAILAEAGPCLVNAGGDLAASGPPTTGVWPVGVETPTGLLALALERGAIATSGRDRRRWRRGGEERHHLIDPATGRPARSDLLRVTAVADCAADAEVLATSLFLGGERRALREAAALSVPCVLVTEDGRTELGGGLP